MTHGRVWSVDREDVVAELDQSVLDMWHKNLTNEVVPCDTQVLVVWAFAKFVGLYEV
jgi:hypothetical protein